MFGSCLRVMDTGKCRTKGMMLAVLVEFRRVGMGNDASSLQIKLPLAKGWAFACLESLDSILNTQAESLCLLARVF